MALCDWAIVPQDGKAVTAGPSREPTMRGEPPTMRPYVRVQSAP